MTYFMGYHVIYKGVDIFFEQNRVKVQAVLLQECRAGISTWTSKRNGRAFKLTIEVPLGLFKIIKNRVGNYATLFIT